MRCDDVIQLLDEYSDDALLPAAHEAIDRHLEDCSACRAALASLRKLIQEAAGLPPLAPRRDLWPGIKSRMSSRRRPYGRAAAVAAIVIGGVTLLFVWEHRRDPLDASIVQALIEEHDRTEAELDRVAGHTDWRRGDALAPIVDEVRQVATTLREDPRVVAWLTELQQARTWWMVDRAESRTVRD